MTKKAKKTRKSRQPSRQTYREARAIIAMAATHSWKAPGGRHPSAPNYWVIAKNLGLKPLVAKVADVIWNDANGPDEGRETEERALERVRILLADE